MDDFLHNLRSGKLKQGGQSNRPYNDPQYKGGIRRNNMMDRRKSGHHDNKESSERLNAIKLVLESLAETQKRMADAYQARTRAEERKARAMEVLAKNLYKMLNPTANDADELFATQALPVAEQGSKSLDLDPTPLSKMKEVVESTLFEEEESFGASDNDAEMDVAAAQEEDADDQDMEEDEEDIITDEKVIKSRGRLTDVDRHTLFSVITQMRGHGDGWEKIARHVSTQGYPTISGKGSWRGIMIKNLYEKMESE